MSDHVPAGRRGRLTFPLTWPAPGLASAVVGTVGYTKPGGGCSGSPRRRRLSLPSGPPARPGGAHGGCLLPPCEAAAHRAAGGRGDKVGTTC